MSLCDQSPLSPIPINWDFENLFAAKSVYNWAQSMLSMRRNFVLNWRSLCSHHSPSNHQKVSNELDAGYVASLVHQVVVDNELWLDKNIYLKMGLFIFGLFKQTINFLQQINVKKLSILYTSPGFEPTTSRTWVITQNQGSRPNISS